MSEKKEEKKEIKDEKLVAKKDFIINQNDHHFNIKKGDELSLVPKHFLPNLKTEGVI
jgi:hypothetical protein